MLAVGGYAIDRSGAAGRGSARSPQPGPRRAALALRGCGSARPSRCAPSDVDERGDTVLGAPPNVVPAVGGRYGAERSSRARRKCLHRSRFFWRCASWSSALTRALTASHGPVVGRAQLAPGQRLARAVHRARPRPHATQVWMRFELPRGGRAGAEVVGGGAGGQRSSAAVVSAQRSPYNRRSAFHATRESPGATASRETR